MDTDYEIIMLSDELALLRWYRTPAKGAASTEAYLHEIKRILDQSTVPVYFLSDLRYGRIVDVRALQKLGQLTQHANMAGSTAFSSDPITALMVRAFRSFAYKADSRHEMQSTPEAALAFLEMLHPGITENIDWETVIGKPSTQSEARSS